MRYKCRQCETIFGAFNYVCPSCGSTDIEEQYKCHKCNEYFKDDDLVGLNYCYECLKSFMTMENLMAFALDDPYYFSEFMYDREVKKKSPTVLEQP